jgi:putative spermidine/putrescine transport system permease protein
VSQLERIERIDVRDAPLARPPVRHFSWAWLGVMPFFLFAFFFLLLPSARIFVGSFQDAQGSFTLENIQGLARQDFINAYRMSIAISLMTAIAGGIFGFLLAYAAVLGGLPRAVRSTLLTFSGVASNFGGVPLAFAFIATMGQTGLITRLIDALTDFDIYRDGGFSIYNFWGLSIVYMYFQFPLMVLIMAPALEGLKREWKEAAENLGASSWEYWRYVALPILMPSFLSTTILLFGNSFGAYATAYAFSGSQINLVPIVIGAQIRGDVLFNPGLGNALALGMVLIMAITLAAYTLIQRRSARWLQR